MALPLQIVCVLANPTNLARFDDAGIWSCTQEGLQSLVSRGLISAERLPNPTESAIRQRLSKPGCDVLHLVAHAQARVSAQYATIALESSAGSARDVTASCFAALVTSSHGLRAVVLQACETDSRCFDLAAEMLSAAGVGAVVLAPPLNGAAQSKFASTLYEGLANGASASALASALGSPVRVVSASPESPIFNQAPSESNAPRRPAPPSPQPQTAAPPPVLQAPPAWQAQIQCKRAAGRYDVFLCYHRSDKPTVQTIAQKLKESGILPWLDIWDLMPGRPWQAEIGRQMDKIASAAVFLGGTGTGPWQDCEIDDFMDEFARRKLPVIPVILQGAPQDLDLPHFLRRMTAVDFRTSDPDPLRCLIWGITGTRPDD